MGVVVQFNYQAWRARYPEFANVSQATATEYFNEATLYCRNDGGGPVCQATTQSLLLNMLTAHLAQINSGTAGAGGPSPLVGRLSNVSEGSISAATQNDYPPGTVQWYQQTKYGSAYWAATMQYRTMHYNSGLGCGVGFFR